MIRGHCCKRLCHLGVLLCFYSGKVPFLYSLHITVQLMVVIDDPHHVPLASSCHIMLYNSFTILTHILSYTCCTFSSSFSLVSLLQAELPRSGRPSPRWLPCAQHHPPCCHIRPYDWRVCSTYWWTGLRWEGQDTEPRSEDLFACCHLLCRTPSSHRKCK